MNKQNNDSKSEHKVRRQSYLPDIKFRGKRICIICNYRTGSTFFIRETFLGNRINPTGNWEYFNDNRDFNFALEQLTIPSKFVFKLMPDHIDHSLVKLDKLSTICDEFMYLYRRDFEAQARSWIAWNMAGDHEHHYGKVKEYNIDVTQEVADRYTQQLIDNYKSMRYAYQKYPGKVYCLEDFSVKIPYDRRYIWKNEISIPSFNVNKEVFRNS